MYDQEISQSLSADQFTATQNTNSQKSAGRQLSKATNSLFLSEMTEKLDCTQSTV